MPPPARPLRIDLHYDPETDTCSPRSDGAWRRPDHHLHLPRRAKRTARTGYDHAGIELDAACDGFDDDGASPGFGHADLDPADAGHRRSGRATCRKSGKGKDHGSRGSNEQGCPQGGSASPRISKDFSAGSRPDAGASASAGCSFAFSNLAAGRDRRAAGAPGRAAAETGALVILLAQRGEPRRRSGRARNPRAGRCRHWPAPPPPPPRRGGGSRLGRSDRCFGREAERRVRRRHSTGLGRVRACTAAVGERRRDPAPERLRSVALRTSRPGRLPRAHAGQSVPVASPSTAQSRGVRPGGTPSCRTAARARTCACGRTSRSRRQGMDACRRQFGEAQPRKRRAGTGALVVTPADYAVFDRLSITAALTRALNATGSMVSPSRISMARRVPPVRLELNRPEGSASAAPRAKVSLILSL